MPSTKEASQMLMRPDSKASDKLLSQVIGVLRSIDRGIEKQATLEVAQV